MGSGAVKPSIGILLLLLVVGLSVLFFLTAFTPHDYSWRLRKLVVGPHIASFKPTATCCATYYAPSLSMDSRGWLLNPITAASRSQIFGAATDCKLVHIGQIKPGNFRGNHRHLLCNETLIVWGAEARFRVENPSVAEGYTETQIMVDEVGVCGCPAGYAHVLANMDSVNTLHLVGCQDGQADPSNTEYNVWTNLKVEAGLNSKKT